MGEIQGNNFKKTLMMIFTAVIIKDGNNEDSVIATAQDRQNGAK